MKSRLLLMLLVLSPLFVACSAQNDATPPAAPAVTGTSAGADATPVDSTPVEGRDYVVIPNGQPFAPLNGTVEVTEFFGYTCIHCANFEPHLEEWTSKLPADVHFRPLPVALSGFWVPYARAYFAAESLGVAEQTHAAVFKALHQEGSLPIQKASDSTIAAFYAKHGVDPAKFVAAMNSPEVAAKVEQANQFAMRSGIEGTPTLVVNGKYRVMGESFDDTLRIADHLVARERTAHE